MEMKRDTEWGIDPNSGPDDDYNRCIRLMLEVMVDFGFVIRGGLADDPNPHFMEVKSPTVHDQDRIVAEIERRWSGRYPGKECPWQLERAAP